MRFDVTRASYGETSGTAELCVTYNPGENVPTLILMLHLLKTTMVRILGCHFFPSRKYRWWHADAYKPHYIAHPQVMPSFFNGRNFSMATGDRKCFNLTIVDDDQLERTTESSSGGMLMPTNLIILLIHAPIRNYHFFDPIYIYIQDDEGL